MNMKSFWYWLPRVIIVPICVFFIYFGVELLTFIVSSITKSQTTTTITTITTADVKEAIAGGIMILFIIVAGLIAIIGGGRHLCDIIWETTCDLLDELVLKKENTSTREIVAKWKAAHCKRQA